MRRIAFALFLLTTPVAAQSPGTVNLVGPSISPGAPQITPGAINAAVNSAMTAKADLTGLTAETNRAQAAESGLLPIGAPVNNTPIGNTAPSTGAFTTLSGAVTATGGSASRSLAAHTGDVLNLLDFGAVCDGTTDDSAAVTAALATHKRIFIPGTVTPGTPTVCNAPSIVAGTQTAGIFTGPGRIKTSDGNLRGTVVSDINSAPANSVGVSASVTNGFNGDWSRSPTPPIEIRITGALTAGNPGSGTPYVITSEIAGRWIIGSNSSGVDTEVSPGVRYRTGVVIDGISATNAGQGDYILRYNTCVVTSTKAGLTDWKGAPECGSMAGYMNAGADNAYLQPIGDIGCNDKGFDASCIGDTLVLIRTNDTAALNNPWVGHFVYSAGTKNVNAAYSYTGPSNMGYDCVDGGNTTGTQVVPCLVMAAGMRIYGNGVNPDGERLPQHVSIGNEYFGYDTVNGWAFYKAGALQFATGGSGPPIFASAPSSDPGVHCAVYVDAGVFKQSLPCP